jgi:hypothetical protein
MHYNGALRFRSKLCDASACTNNNYRQLEMEAARQKGIKIRIQKLETFQWKHAGGSHHMNECFSLAWDDNVKI